MAFDSVTYAAAKGAAKSYTDSLITTVSGGLKYKGAVDYYSDLPASPSENDAYTVKYIGTSGATTDGSEYVWAKYNDVLQWIKFGPDLTEMTAAEVDTLWNEVTG